MPDKTVPQSPPTESAILPEEPIYTIRDILDFRGTLASLAAQVRTYPWERLVATFRVWSREDVTFELDGILKPAGHASRSLLHDLPSTAAIVLVAQHRPKNPAPGPDDLMQLGIMLDGGNHEAEVLDYIIAGEGGDWQSVFDVDGLRGRTWCPACQKHTFFSGADLPEPDADWMELRDSHRPGCPAAPEGGAAA